MIENIAPVEMADVVATVAGIKADGWRLVTMSCTELDENSVDLLYHFDKDLAMKHLRLTVPRTEKVPSISGVYFAALLVENEIQDLFGLCFGGLVLDYGQTLLLDEEVRRTPFCKYTVVKQ